MQLKVENRTLPGRKPTLTINSSRVFLAFWITAATKILSQSNVYQVDSLQYQTSPSMPNGSADVIKMCKQGACEFIMDALQDIP